MINGGIYFEEVEQNIQGPFLSSDFANDVELKKTFESIKEKIVQTKLKEEEILNTVYDHLRVIKYLYDSPRKERLKNIKRLVRIGPLVFRLGGICCYQAFTVCVILEKLLLSGDLRGKVFYANGKGHGWPLYLSKKDDNLYILDTTQGKFFNLNREKDRTFCGYEEKDGKEIYGRFKYIDYLTPQIVLYKP